MMQEGRFSEFYVSNVIVLEPIISPGLFDRVNTGLFCSTPGVAVARSVPNKVALHMLLTSEPLTAQGLLLFCCFF